MSFSLDFTGSPKELIDRIQAELSKNNGSHSGDENEGKISVNSFLGNISGEYKVNKNKIEINIIKKPMFISEGMIRDEIKKFI